MVPDLYSTDRQVLAAIVEQIEVNGRTAADLPSIYRDVGLEKDQGYRSVRRLVGAEMVTIDGSQGPRGGLGKVWMVTGVTERGLREVGAWPDRADQLAAQLIAALAEAAEHESEPEQKSKLRRAASGVADVGQKALTEVVASYMAKMSGAN